MQGRTLQELAKEIERQQESKRDFRADTRHLALMRSDPDTKDERLDLLVAGQGEFPMRETFHRQLGSRLGIPKPYYDRCLREAPGLLAANANHWLSKKPERRLVRTLDGNARAFLSDRFRIFDNEQMLGSALPVMADLRVEVVSCEVTERRLYLKAVLPRLQREVQVGDAVQAGIVVSNSEIGLGSIRVDAMIWRLICLNGMVTGDTMRKAHLGRGADDALGDGAEEFYRDDTWIAEDKALSLKLRDTMQGFLSEQYFTRKVETLREAVGRRITGHPEKVVEVVANKLSLTEGESGGVLRHLIEGGDLSAWGLANAVTRTANDSEDYDRGTKLQRLGNRIIDLSPKDWKVISEAA